MGKSEFEIRKSMKEYRNKMDELIKKYGYVIENVMADEDGSVNYHTHGLMESFKHLDFQIVLRIKPEQANALIKLFVARVKSGEVFSCGTNVSGIIDGEVVLIETLESNRPVLRIILPDENGLFPGEEGCEPEYDFQFYSQRDALKAN